MQEGLGEGASAFLECAWHVRLPVKGVGVAKRAGVIVCVTVFKF